MSRTLYRVTLGGKSAWAKGKRAGVTSPPVGAKSLLSAAQAARLKRFGDRIGATVRSVPVAEGAAPKKKATKARAKKKGKPSKAEFLRRMAAGRAKAARKRRR